MVRSFWFLFKYFCQQFLKSSIFLIFTFETISSAHGQQMGSNQVRLQKNFIKNDNKTVYNRNNLWSSAVFYWLWVNIINTNSTNFLSKLSTAFSIVFGILYLYVIVFNFITSKLWNTQKQNRKFALKIFQIHDSFHFQILHILIPLFIVTRQNILFFIVATGVVFNRFRIFFREKKHLNGFLYFKLYIVELGWVLYHLIFFTFWLIDFIQIQVTNKELLNFLGIYLVFFIIFAALVELLDFLNEKVFKNIKIVYRKLKFAIKSSFQIVAKDNNSFKNIFIKIVKKMKPQNQNGDVKSKKPKEASKESNFQKQNLSKNQSEDHEKQINKYQQQPKCIFDNKNYQNNKTVSNETPTTFKNRKLNTKKSNNINKKNVLKFDQLFFVKVSKFIIKLFICKILQQILPQLRMIKLKIVNGDITKCTTKYVAHQINCKTTYAKGLASAIFKLWPYSDVYSTAEKRTPGNIIVKGNGQNQRFVINMAAQIYPGKANDANDSSQLRLKWFKQCLGQIGKIKELNSISFPYNIGCGLAGGNWMQYEKALIEFSQTTNAEVILYKYQN